MKISLTLIAFFLIIPLSFAQKKLSQSRQSSIYTYIYKLTDKEALEIFSNPKTEITDRYFHSILDSFLIEKIYTKKLDFGHYLYVSASKNSLNYRLENVRNVDIQFINNLKDFQFYVADLQGNLIQHAKAKINNGKAVYFDSQAQIYHSSFPKKEEVISIDYDGITNFFNYDLRDNNYNPRKSWSFFKKVIYSFPIKYTWQPIKSLFKKKYKQKKPQYAGYMVFSKPKYKPLDTVKFKAYLLTNKGDLIKNKLVQIKLMVDGKAKILSTILPYKDGGYEYSFVLADSLGLKLDRNYNIALVDKEKELNMISQSFNYEDYELKSVHFSSRTNKDEHQIGSPIALYLKATDENELAVPDGRVEILALTNNVAAFYKNKVYVPDTLWKKSLKLDPIGETKLTLPDSIFPKADLKFNLRIKFLNSNNETRNDNKYLSFKYSRGDSKTIKSSLKKDSLFIDYHLNNKSAKEKATVAWYTKDDLLLDSQFVSLPKVFKTDYRASYIEVKTAGGFKDEIYLSDFSPKLSIGAVQSKDSLRVVVNNENKIPFWYTIFSGNKIFFKGYTKNLDTIFKHTINKAAHIRINYYWDEREKIEEVSAFYNPNILTVRLISPDVVYPGQQVNMLVKVTDVNNLPVSNTDLTAYASTSKFTNNYTPSIPSFQKSFLARKKDNIQFEADDSSVGQSIRLNWKKWGKTLGLDTIEYYKFTHPNEIYTNTENSSDTSITQVAPFAILNGDLDPVKVLYIDEIPVFFDQADQLQRYSFKVEPGKHSFRLRTENYMIVLNNFEVEKGKKTIIGISAEDTNTIAKVTKQPNKFLTYEAQLLNRYLFKVANNFDGEKTTVEVGDDKMLLNPAPNVYANKDLIIGPLKENILTFKSGNINQDFVKETGYTYTFTPGLIKQKSYAGEFAFNVDLSKGVNAVNTDFKQYILKQGEVDSIWIDYLNLRSFSTPLFKNSIVNYNTSGRLEFKIDTAFTKKLPYIKNIIIYKPSEPSFIQIFPGNAIATRFNLEKGEYRLMFLLKDNRYFIAEQVNVLPKGFNYYEWQQFKIQPADQFSVKLDESIKAIKLTGYYNVRPIDVEILERFNERNFDDKTLTGRMRGRIISAVDKMPIPGAVLKVVGLSKSTSTDANGYFILHVPQSGQVSISYIGYTTKVIKIVNGNVGDEALEENRNALQEIVVVGYGTVSKNMLTGSASVVSALQGRVAGVNIGSSEMLMIRGTASLSASQKPLILVDGLPFAGDVSSLAPEDILEINVLKDAEATAIYGARAANGVIIVKTKKGNATVNAAGELVSQQQTMRTNFSDEGFWQPKLITDDTGTAKFSVKFPDDITNWKTRVIAMNGKKQAGYTETFIKSFKSLSANFVSPLFATEGDEINVIGKLMNYTPFEETVNRKFSYNGTELRNSAIKFKNAHIDTVAIAVTGKDSLKFEYTLQQDNGYFDGEIRKIPVIAQGVLETKGYFSAMLRDTSITYNFDKNLGKITLRAESSIFPILLDEMTKLRNYEYFCNEQLASKLKGLLLEKQVRSYLNQPFNHEKDILFIIKKLQQNKKPQGTWAWWQNGDEQIWISFHVVDALLKAEKQGYKIELNKQVLYTYLVNKLVDQRYDYSQVQTLKLLHLLNHKYFIKDWVIAFEKEKREVKPSLFEQLEMMELKQIAGIKINTDSLIKIKKNTMFGSIYWGNESMRFWDNSIQNTLIAYRLLKNAGGYEKELEKISLYFLEQRKDGQWRNTFESSLILETILPEMIGVNQKIEPASLNLNNEMVTSFPYDKVLENTSEIILSKQGKMPIYFTAYQQFTNQKPEKVSKDFTVNTSFIQNGNAVTKLKAGTLSTLKVDVEVRADADYVMIEIPIPAGCSYENKMQSFWGVENHREYFKNKTSIFCTKLKQGKYTFNIDLMPRYSGSYVLNPAKAEMMYFPVFYGREGMKKVGIN